MDDTDGKRVALGAALVRDNVVRGLDSGFFARDGVGGS